MEEGRRKIRICLLCVVMAAVLAGLIYYFSETYQIQNISDGTLVYNGIDFEEERWQNKQELFI